VFAEVGLAGGVLGGAGWAEGVFAEVGLAGAAPDEVACPHAFAAVASASANPPSTTALEAF
jgi:hypothetical protein